MKTKLTLLSLFICLFSQAQNVRKAIIKIDATVAGESLDVPFAGIKVLDARFDQSKIGCIYNTVTPFGLSTYKFDAVFPDSLKNYLPELISTFARFHPQAKDSLFVLIKNFRIADHFVYDAETEFQIQLTLNISASFYSIHADKYFKLFSINDVLMDEIYRVHEKKKIKHNEGTRAMSLTKMMYRLLQNKNFTADTTKPFFKTGEIDLAMKKRFDLPLYSSALKAGIYKSFEEFRNNTPSITDIKTNYEKGKLKSVTDNTGKEIDFKNYWGVCDGQKRYIVFREEFTELVPCDKGFKILSYRTKADMRGKTNFGDAATKYGILPTTFAKMGDGLRTPEYFDLNLDTGNLFLEEIFGQSGLSKMQSELLK